MRIGILGSGLIGGKLGRDIGEFSSAMPPPLSHRLKVTLHLIDTHRDAVDQRKCFQVFREHRREPSRFAIVP
jgi:hypothetical protein